MTATTYIDLRAVRDAIKIEAEREANTSRCELSGFFRGRARRKAAALNRAIKAINEAMAI